MLTLPAPRLFGAAAAAGFLAACQTLPPPEPAASSTTERPPLTINDTVLDTAETYSPPDRSKPLIYVLDLKGTNVTEADADFLTQALWYSFRESEDFLMLLREDQARILQSRGINLADPYAPPPNMTRVGRALEADYLVYGTVTRAGETYAIETHLLDVVDDEIVGIGNLRVDAGATEQVRTRMPEVQEQLVANLEIPQGDRDSTAVAAVIEEPPPSHSPDSPERSEQAPPPQDFEAEESEAVELPQPAEEREPEPEPAPLRATAPEPVIEEVEEETTVASASDRLDNIFESDETIEFTPDASEPTAVEETEPVEEEEPAPEEEAGVAEAPEPVVEEEPAPEPVQEEPVEEEPAPAVAEEPPPEPEPVEEPTPEPAEAESAPSVADELPAPTEPDVASTAAPAPEEDTTTPELSDALPPEGMMPIDEDIAAAQRRVEQAVEDAAPASAASETDPAEARRLMQQAVDYPGDSPLRAQALERALELDPHNPDILMLAARTHLEQGERDRALDECLLSLQQRPTANGYIVLGSLYHDRNEFEEAAAAQQQALEMEPGNHFALYNLGLSLWQIDQSRAREAFQRFVDLAAGIPEQRSFVERAQGYLERNS